MSIKMLYVHALPIDTLAADAVQVLKMCQAFSNSGVDVTLAASIGKKKYNEEEYKKIIEEQMGEYPTFSIVGYKVYTIFGKFKLLGGYFSAKKLMRKSKSDLVFLRNVVLVRAAIKTNTPFIYEAHNSLMHNNSALLNRYWTDYMLGVVSSSLFLKFVTISHELGKFWIDKGIPEEKVISVHDGFDSESFKSIMSKDQAREIVGLPVDEKIVLYMGSLFADRGIGNIIDLAEKIPDVNFLIVGGTERECMSYQKTAQQREVENVKFWCRVNHKDVPVYLYAADILLMIWSRKVKTIEYCSPLKLFEYMASGRLIVGHGFTTIREVLVDREDAFLVDPDLPGDLYEKLKLAVESDNPDEVGAHARQKAFDMYTWEKRANTILDSLPESLVDGSA